jgi:hypothetical protein
MMLSVCAINPGKIYLAVALSAITIITRFIFAISVLSINRLQQHVTKKQKKQRAHFE